MAEVAAHLASVWLPDTSEPNGREVPLGHRAGGIDSSERATARLPEVFSEGDPAGVRLRRVRGERLRPGDRPVPPGEAYEGYNGDNIPDYVPEFWPGRHIPSDMELRDLQHFERPESPLCDLCGRNTPLFCFAICAASALAHAVGTPSDAIAVIGGSTLGGSGAYLWHSGGRTRPRGARENNIFTQPDTAKVEFTLFNWGSAIQKGTMFPGSEAQNIRPIPNFVADLDFRCYLIFETVRTSWPAVRHAPPVIRL